MKKNVTTDIAPLAIAKGSNGQVELYKDKVRITRKGLWAKFLQSHSGDVEIPIRSITAIEFKKSGFLEGHVRFIYPGVGEKPAALAADPSMVQFGRGALQSFETIKGLIEQLRDQLSQPADHKADTALDEIEKLASLHQRGILTDEEFRSKKAQLLRG